MTIKELKKQISRTDKYFRIWAKSNAAINACFVRDLHYYEKELKKLTKEKK